MTLSLLDYLKIAGITFPLTVGCVSTVKPDSARTQPPQLAYSDSLNKGRESLLDTTGISSAIIDYLMLTKRLPNDYATTESCEDGSIVSTLNPKYKGQYDVPEIFRRDLYIHGYTLDDFNRLGAKRAAFIAFNLLKPTGVLDTMKTDYFDEFKKIGLDSSQIEKLRRTYEIDVEAAKDSLIKYQNENKIKKLNKGLEDSSLIKPSGRINYMGETKNSVFSYYKSQAGERVLGCYNKACCKEVKK